MLKKVFQGSYNEDAAIPAMREPPKRVAGGIGSVRTYLNIFVIIHQLKSNQLELHLRYKRIVPKNFEVVHLVMPFLED